MSVHGISLAAVMKLTAIVALDLALINRGIEFLITPVSLFLLATLNAAIVQAVILGQPFRISQISLLIIGMVSAVAITALLADGGPSSRMVWVLIAMGLPLVWVASLMMCVPSAGVKNRPPHTGLGGRPMGAGRRTVLPGADTDRGRGEARPVRRW